MTKSQYLRDRVFLNMAANRRFYARASIDNLTRISTTADYWMTVHGTFTTLVP